MIARFPIARVLKECRMKGKFLLGIAAAVAMTVAGLAYAGLHRATPDSCCYPGSPCCQEGSPCCSGCCPDGACCPDGPCCKAAK